MIHILTGPVHSGKTSLLRDSLPLLRQIRSLSGYLSLSLWEEGRLEGYDLYDISVSHRHPFIRRTGEEEWERIGSFYFIPWALETAREMITRAPDEGGRRELRIIDEIGPLELNGRGIWPALSRTLDRAQPDLLITARNTIVDEVTSLFPPASIGSVFNTEEERARLRLMEELKDV